MSGAMIMESTFRGPLAPGYYYECERYIIMQYSATVQQSRGCENVRRAI